MARVLTILRDGTLRGQIDLGTGVKLGRGHENDVVLEDDQKRVSRHHAELTVEPGDRIVLTDLGSSNGTLVSGQPITSIELTPGTPFSIGPYQLVIEDSDEWAHASGSVQVEQSAPPSEPPPARRITPEPPEVHDDPGWMKTLRSPRAVIAAGIAGLAVAGTVGYFAASSVSPQSPAAKAQTLVEEARELYSQGDLPNAFERLRQALRIAPELPEARELAAEWGEPIDPVPPSAKTSIAPQVRDSPPNEPPPSLPPPIQPFPTVAPQEERGIPRRPGEPDVSYQIRVKRVRAELDRARQAERDQQYVVAVQILRELLASSPGVSEAEALLKKMQSEIVAQGTAEHAARLRAMRAAADQARGKDDIGAEIEALEQLLKVEPQPTISDRLTELRRRAGEIADRALSNGSIYENADRFEDARNEYRKILNLGLPPGDRRREEAMRRLKELGG